MANTLSKLWQVLGFKKDNKVIQYNKSNIISAYAPDFSSFGNDAIVSDIVKTAIHRIAEEVSKCSIRHVIVNQNPKSVELVNDELNLLFKTRINPIATLKDFLYKITYLTLVNSNCFIYWQYEEEPIKGTNLVRRITKGLYPIEASEVRIYYADEWRIELKKNQVVFDLPYSDVIHIRSRFGANQLLGGNSIGKTDFKEMLKNLEIMHVIKEAVPKSLEASLSVKGILSMKTVADIDKKELTRDEFESHLFSSKYGIVATDYESEFTPININATDIPSNTLAFIRDEILSPFGVSLPIYQGKFTDDEHNAFYQTAVEGILISIYQSFTTVLLTNKQISKGHEIRVYDRLAQSQSFKTRKDVVEMVMPTALLSRDEQRELLGYEPDGKPTMVSLNYIDTSIANEYQLEYQKGDEKNVNTE